MYQNNMTGEILSFWDITQLFPWVSFPETGPNDEWLLDNGYSPYVAPVEPVKPFQATAISMRQCRLALLAHGLLDSVNNAIMSMPQASQIEWEYASQVQRDNPLVAGMMQLLGMDAAQMDALFNEAYAL